MLVEIVDSLTTTLHSLDELVFVLDCEGRFIDFHAPPDRPLMMPPEMFLGRLFRESLPPHLAEPLAEKLALVQTTGTVQEYEYQIPLAGQPTWWSARISLRHTRAGEPAGYTIVSRDVTARRYAEEQVRQLNARLSHRVGVLTEPMQDFANVQLADLFDLEEIQRIQDAFASATGVASIITDPSGVPLTRPSNFCRLCSAIIRGTEKGRCNCFHSDAVLGRHHPQGPVIQRCLSGGLWDAGTSVSAGEKHIANWLIGQVRDESIDEEAMLEYARRIGADEREFRSALAEVPTMPLTQFEKVCEALYLIGDQLSRLALRNLQQARFITERQRLEERLRQSQKLEAVGQLAGGVAHDFNNILTAQFMHLALLRERSDLPEEVRESLEALQTGSRMAADLTRQLLAFSRRQILQIRPLELNALVANLLKLFRRVLGEHIALHLSPAVSALHVEGDAGMIEQVVINLVVNARDAMPRGGILRLETAVVRLGADETRGHPEARPGEFALVSIGDTGCGMSPDMLAHVFEPFYTTKDVGAGTGLGLATVYGIVKQHNGWIEVDSRPGEGSTFRVYLPLAAEHQPAVAHEPSVAACRGAAELILVVEDEVVVRTLLARILRGLGYRVVEAADGLQALELWQVHRHEIRLLFTDMVMPGGVDGRELAERLLAEEPSLQVILASGYSLELAREGLPEERCAFLAKPYDKQVVAEMVRGALAFAGQ